MSVGPPLSASRAQPRIRDDEIGGQRVQEAAPQVPQHVVVHGRDPSGALPGLAAQVLVVREDAVREEHGPRLDEDAPAVAESIPVGVGDVGGDRRVVEAEGPCEESGQQAGAVCGSEVAGDGAVDYVEVPLLNIDPATVVVADGGAADPASRGLNDGAGSDVARRRSRR